MQGMTKGKLALQYYGVAVPTASSVEDDCKGVITDVGNHIAFAYPSTLQSFDKLNERSVARSHENCCFRVPMTGFPVLESGNLVKRLAKTYNATSTNTDVRT